LLSETAWRIKIPSSSPIYGVDVKNNVLKFLGMVVTMWLAIVKCEETSSKATRLCPHDQRQHFSNRVAVHVQQAAPWLILILQANTNDHKNAADMLSHQQHPLLLASRHIQGDHNTSMSVLLSFTGDVRGFLTQRFHSLLPQLIPEDFDISHCCTARFFSLFSFRLCK
jgi:hypothetical protein